MKTTFKRLRLLIIIIGILVTVSLFDVSTKNAISDNVVKATREKNQLTLIIDAGHGGEDGGAVSPSGVKESEINLEIAMKLDQIMGFYGIQTVMTRTSEVLDYSAKSDTIREKKSEDQKSRLKLIMQTDRAILISIHQNKYPDTSPFGAQALYAPTNGSKEFAEYMQKALVAALNPKNRRSAAKVPANILLMNHIKCPAILIECGFLSNREEEKLLKSDAYRLKVAAVIAAGFLYNQNSLVDIYAGGTNEG